MQQKKNITVSFEHAVFCKKKKKKSRHTLKIQLKNNFNVYFCCQLVIYCLLHYFSLVCQLVFLWVTFCFYW